MLGLTFFYMKICSLAKKKKRMWETILFLSFSLVKKGVWGFVTMAKQTFIKMVSR